MNIRLLLLKKSILLGFMVNLFSSSEAQEIKFKKNVISINQARSKLFEEKMYSYQSSIFNVTTFSYERMVYEKFSVIASYGQWFLFQRQEGRDMIFYTTPRITYWRDDVVSKRYNYSYADLLVGYKLYNYKSIYAKAHLGISGTWGTKEYLNYVYRNPEPPEDVLFFTSEKKSFDIGMIASLSCSYSFWKERIKAGVFTTGRYYPGLQSKQLDIGLQLGFCF